MNNNNLALDRKNAQHGEFFFVEFIANNGQVRKSPVFILSTKNNDNEDVVVCSCTSQPAKTDFDIPVQLKKKTCVRTNKIYTIRRTQLLFKIPQRVQHSEYLIIMNKLKETLKIN